ncbi:hypothetical protein [Sulfoacidibacillus thermotolerans]|uniref:Uncharacterized protein n=1 Tax=Sulfoacidibacillus thermotolerans TaxID=1765684 RepID=A0A2U3D769_SULT2|nr:hypothetical protein [Sulfoacidibacillus thermotolerans]PWI57111.1 hypothetical protein BM613_10155 [Sulfoacidibacillus thermotolerans]
MVVFGLGSFRRTMDVTPILEALATQMQKDFPMSVEILPWDDENRKADLVLSDISEPLKTLRITELKGFDRMFILQGGPTKLTEDLQRFLRSIAQFHGRPVRFVANQTIHDDVYSVDANWLHGIPGFQHAEGTAPDVRLLAGALFQEYYEVRLEAMQQERIEQLLLAMAETASSHETAGEAAAAEFLGSVLKALNAPFATKQLIINYVRLRGMFGQPMLDAMRELLPVALADNGMQTLLDHFRVENELSALMIQQMSPEPTATDGK